ncbi:MAG: prefoldin subunit alpha [Conexivisphaerales archaeon]
MSSELETKINELANLIGVLENYYESIMSRIYLLSQALEDSTAASNAIKALPESETSEIVLPIGGDIYVQVNYTPDSKIMVKVGDGVVVVRSKESSLAFLNSRIEEFNKALNAAQGDKNEVENRIKQARLELNNLMKRSENVR